MKAVAGGTDPTRRIDHRQILSASWFRCSVRVRAAVCPAGSRHRHGGREHTAVESEARPFL
jgi:hypothetical protein